MASTVRIYWSREFDNKQMWNEVCAWAIERFDLPGDRFYTEANVNYMDFHFKSNKDALDRKSTRLNSSHMSESRMPSSA